MKRNSTFYSVLTLTALAFMYFLQAIPVYSQSTTEEITEGKDYWFGIPHCKMLQPEAIRGEYPIVVWVSSKVDTRATITDIQTGTVMTKEIKKNQITQFPMGDHLMNRESEIITDNGIHLTSEAPVSVTVYLSYKWSGEAYRVIPVEWLGRRYYTLNLYQDRTDEYKPAQILIIATQNNTKVTYIPSANTVKKNKGVTGSVLLNKGQTFLIEGRIDPGLNQDWASDLTGTSITANKPIAVISGHTKGAFPRYNYGMPNNYQEHYANFLRNMLCDMLWPVELLGKEYVSIPIKYTDRPRGQTNIQDDRGDLIRFVATEDGTELYQLRQDGSSYMKIGPTMKRGQWYNITNQENPAHYKSNKPILAGQYGKTWWSEDVPGRDDDRAKGDDEQPLNPHRNGQGMMLVLAPIEHWTSYAPFKSPTEIDNFFYMTFDSKDRANIYFDNEKITTKFGTAIREIKGTPYEYIVQQIQAGDHWIEGKEGAKFAAYAYGNWDRTKDGFAYGYPIGINFALRCNDSIYVQETVNCGDVLGDVFAVDLQKDTLCAAVLKVEIDAEKPFENYTFEYDFVEETHFQFTLKVKDLRKPATATIIAQTKSGKVVRKTYTYEPEQIAVEPVVLDFGLLKVNDNPCKTFRITNIGKTPVVISDIKIDDGPYANKFTLNTAGLLPLTLDTGEFADISACAIADELLEKTEVKATVTAVLSCYQDVIDTLRYIMGEPVVWIDDATWSNVLVNTEVPKKVMIVNKGEMDVILYSLSWPDADKVRFTRVDPIPFPLTLHENETYEFTAYYKPDEIGVVHKTQALFIGNTENDKLYSDWTGNGIDAGPFVEGYNWLERRVIDQFAGTNEYAWHVNIGNNDTKSNTPLDFVDLVIENDPDNVFRLDKTFIPNILTPNNPIQVPAFFAPKAEKEYKAVVTLKTKLQTLTKDISDTLRGIGTLPHVNTTDIDFGTLLVGTYKDDISVITNVRNIYPMPLTITKLSIETGDKDAFVINQSWLNDHPYPIVIPVNGSLDVPIRFTPVKGGTHSSQLVVTCDAPDKDSPNSFNEKPIGDLKGIGYRVGVDVGDYDYPEIFRTQTRSEGKVYFTNLGTEMIAITNNIGTSLLNNTDNYFKIEKWYTKKDPTNINPAPPIYLNGSENDDDRDMLFVEVSYHPMVEGNHSVQVQYVYDNGQTAESYVTGKATFLKTIAEIPKGYISSPDVSAEPLMIEFKINKNDTEPKLLEQANITSFIARVQFKAPSRVDLLDVAPLVESCADITKTGTMTDGWTCESATIVDSRILEVKMTGTKPLAGNGTLFKFPMKCYLSDQDTIPLPCEFIPLGEPAGWVEVDNIPGNIRVEPVCVNTMRLIQFIKGVDNLGTSTPNPVNDKSEIQYFIGHEGNAVIALFNSNGEKVATLVDKFHNVGYHDLTIDVISMNLPSGVYNYRLETARGSITKQLVISK